MTTTLPKSRQAAPLSTNVLANVCGYCLSAVVAFVISPIIVHSLGDARYGTWSLFGDLIGYYGLLDVGITGAVTYYVARHLGTSDLPRVQETLSTAFGALSVIGLLALGIGLAIVLGLPHIWNTPGVDLSEIRTSFVIMAIGIAANFPMAVFSAALVGHRRLDIVNSTEVVIKVVSAVAIWLLLLKGAGMIGLAAVTVAGRLLTWIVFIIASKNIGVPLPQRNRFHRRELKNLLSYGGKNAFINIAARVIYRTDSLVIAAFLGVRWVTYFSIGGMLVTYFSNACGAITLAFTPHLTHLHAKGDMRQRNETYLLGVRLSGTLATAGTAYLLAFGKSFIRLWLGDSYVSGPLTYRSDVVMAVLLFAELPRVVQSISRQLLFATENQRYLMWLSLAEAAANLGLSLILVRGFGLVGVALGTMIPMLVTHLWFLPRYVVRTFDVNVSEYFTNGVKKPLASGLAVLILSQVILMLNSPQSWSRFFMDVLIAAALGAGLIAAIGLTRAERSRVRNYIGLGALVVDEH